MEVTESRSGPLTTLKIVGRVDSSVSKMLEQKIVEAVSRDGHLVVDLGGMHYVSSAGLRCFIILAKQAQTKNQIVGLSGISDEVGEIFDLSGLLALFKIYDSVEAAAAADPASFQLQPGATPS